MDVSERRLSTKLAISPAGFHAVNVAVVIEELSGRQSLGLVFGNDVTISEVIEMLLPTVPNSSSSARRLPGGATSDP